MNKFFHHLPRLGLFVILIGYLPYQQAIALDQVELQFVSFPKAAESNSVELYTGEGKTIKVEIPTNNVSPSYKVARVPTWALGESVTDEEGKSKFTTFGKAPSIAAKKQLILVIRKGHDNSSGLTLYPIQNSETELGGGKYLLMNMSKVDIAAELSDKKLALKPGKFSIVKPTPSSVKGVYKYCETKFHFRLKNGEVRKFFSSNWRLNDKARSFIFFYHDPRNRKLRFHSIRDYP